MAITVTDSVARLSGQPDLEVQLRRSARAQRLNLRVSGLDGKVTLSMPRRLPMREAIAFLSDKEDWLRAAVTRVPGPRPLRPGATLLLRGREHALIASPGLRRVTEAEGALNVPPDPDGTRTPARLGAYLKAAAQAALLPRVERHARRLGRPVAAISLRDTRSRWGSCTADGRLMFSWRLVMAPPEVLDYVAAHEVAHLRHMDHSRAFWACVSELMPDYSPHRDWLRQHGAQLHSYRFNARPTSENG
ncbi:MAG: M48 family metallopeptidase [Roseinatronobacter sp.]